MNETICLYGNERCLCQWCPKQCNNGLMCADCQSKNRSVHDVYICTGFTEQQLARKTSTIMRE